MPLAFLTFFTGLAISVVAIYYSVIGLAAIFAAAVIPIIVMGSILEVSKLVAAWWLKANWHRAPFLLKSYMLVAVVVLMVITSMGIFGFLSKAHTEQAVPAGDAQAKIQIIDERVAIEQEVIEQARRDLTILNQQIERFSELGAVSRGVNARNQQREERDALNTQITDAQDRISVLRQERAPFAASLRVIEAEVGPIKYIAALIYGDSPDQNLLEKAVVWVIIIIVFVFDPLAVLLLLASQMSFRWAQEEKEKQYELVQKITQTQKPSYQQTTQSSQPVVESANGGNQRETVTKEDTTTRADTASEEKLRESPHDPGWMYSTPLATTVAAAAKEVEEIKEEPALVYVADVGEKPTAEELHEIDSAVEDINKLKPAVINLSAKKFLADDFDLSNFKFPEKPFRGQQIKLDPNDDDSYYIFNGIDWVHSPLSHAAEDEGYRQNSEQNPSTIWSKIQDKKNG